MSYHILLFDVIAPFYNFAFKRQLKNYRKFIKEQFDFFPQGVKTILDIGCGTGAFSLALSEAGFEVTAVDASSSMIRIAERNLRGTSVRIFKTDFLKTFPYEEKSIDFAVASFVLHGYRKEGRKRLYGEISRVSRNGALFHDFFPNRNFIISIIEWIERSDYKRFVKIAFSELKENFRKVERIRLSDTYGWYICKL